MATTYWTNVSRMLGTLATVGIFLCLGAVARAQPAPNGAASNPSSFDQGLHYSDSIEALHKKYKEHLKVRDQLSVEFRQLLGQFTAAGMEAQSVSAQADAEFRTWLQAYMRSSIALSAANPATSASAAAFADIDTINTNPVRSMRSNIGRTTAELLNANQRVMQLQFARQLNAQRLQKLQEELGTLGTRAQIWSEQEFQIIRDYLKIADLANLRSHLELRAARDSFERELDDAPQNSGAKLAMAVVHLRLDEVAEARTILDQLVDQKDFVAPLAKCVRAELLASQNQTQLAKRDLVAVRELKLPEAVLLQARAFNKLGDTRQAESLWQALAKSTEFEPLARCHLALAQITGRTNEAKAKRAAADAQLIVDLTGGDLWYCHLTSAICLAASGQKDEALQACDTATELAVGNKKQLCLDVAHKIRNGESVAWQP